jgi:hypothetical protein
MSQDEVKNITDKILNNISDLPRELFRIAGGVAS